MKHMKNLMTLGFFSLMALNSGSSYAADWQCQARGGMSRADIVGAIKLQENTDGSYKVLYSRLKTGPTDGLIFDIRDFELASNIQCKFAKNNSLIFSCEKYSTSIEDRTYLTIRSSFFSETSLYSGGGEDAGTSNYLKVSVFTNIAYPGMAQVFEKGENSFFSSDYAKCGFVKSEELKNK